VSQPDLEAISPEDKSSVEALAKYLIQCERILIEHLRAKGWPVDRYNIRLVAVDPKRGT
jgi:hypothetical protein